MILFQDRITAYHKEQTEDPDDATTQERIANTPFLKNEPCQISYSGNDKGSPKTRERLPQERELKVFVWFDGIPKGEMFRRGDFVRIERTSETGETISTHEGTIGDPRIYSRGIAHVELSLEAQT